MNAFRKCRAKAGLLQETAAAALDVDRSTIAKWETGIAKGYNLRRWIADNITLQRKEGIT